MVDLPRAMSYLRIMFELNYKEQALDLAESIEAKIRQILEDKSQKYIDTYVFVAKGFLIVEGVLAGVENQKDLVSALGDQNPDVILLGGDIFDDVLSDDNTLAFLDGIQGMAPTFYVSGNHEIWSRRYGEMAEQLKKRGVTILSGTNHQLNRLH